MSFFHTTLSLSPEQINRRRGTSTDSKTGRERGKTFVKRDTFPLRCDYRLANRQAIFTQRWREFPVIDNSPHVIKHRRSRKTCRECCFLNGIYILQRYIHIFCKLIISIHFSLTRLTTTRPPVFRVKLSTDRT